MRILQLCNKPPFPPKDGGGIAMNNITRGLLDAGHEVKLLTVFTNKHDLELSKLSKEYIDATDVEGVFIDTQINLVDAFSSLITQDSYNVSRFFSPDLDIRLTEILKRSEFEVVHLESLFMTPYIGTIRRFSNAKIVLRSHNLEYIIWERIAAGTKNRAKRAYLKYLSKKLKAYELSVINQVDGIASISKEDQMKYVDLGCDKPTVNVPFGVNISNYPNASVVSTVPTLFHIGAMDWRPNLEGILWFLEDVWPKVSERCPKLKLHLAGRGLDHDMIPSNIKNVVVHGEVESATEFMAEHSMMIVPLLSAGGIRVKIIEGMASGKTVISTSVGAEGIDYTKDEDIIIADDSKSMIDQIEQLVNAPNTIQQIGERARKKASVDFDNVLIINNLIAFYSQLIEAK